MEWEEREEGLVFLCFSYMLQGTSYCDNKGDGSGDFNEVADV
jgi:hypothetical protein